uniref:NADH-ubiquinone oxidoreductase chain 3 n=1 Tax=Sogata hakonensis TaxID=871477 RepID=A0A7S5DC32_9HEMI|nr:NADH dehydrogenase subunit 3 [Sogata hakonensis]
MKIIWSILLTLIILIIMMISSFLMSKKSILDINKTTQFECGFSKFSSPRLSFSVHFFFIAIIFLMFDIELAIMLPMTISMKMMNLNQWIFSSYLITMIITYGLYHEWINGAIEWSK